MWVLIGGVSIVAFLFFWWLRAVKSRKEKSLRLAERRARTKDELRLASYPPPFPNGEHPVFCFVSPFVFVFFFFFSSFRLVRSSSIAHFSKGWYHVAHSRNLQAGELIPVSALGLQLVVFRSLKSGVCTVVDAICPHLGANIGVGGKVVGDCVQCPFHLFNFQGKESDIEDIDLARCKSIPGLDEEKIPGKLGLKSYPCREVDGMVLMWWHAAGGSPEYYPESQPEIKSGEMVYRGSHSSEAKMHLIEFAENSADFQHFAALHGRMMVPFTQFEIPGITITHHATWEQDSERNYMTYFHDKASLNFFGWPIPRSDAQADITFFGPGSIVWFKFTIPNMGNIIMYQTHLPVEALHQQVEFLWYAPRSMPSVLVWYVVGSWVSQWAQDLSIWENKLYLQSPFLVTSDGPVQRLRRWYKQFYEGHH